MFIINTPEGPIDVDNPEVRQACYNNMMNKEKIMTEQKLTVDTFTTTTFDGYPVELVSAVEYDDAIIYLPGLVKARISKTLPTLQAFAVFNNAATLTYTEIRKQLDI